MKKAIIILLSLLIISINAMAAEKTDSLMAIYGGVFDSFTGAAVKANVYLLREDKCVSTLRENAHNSSRFPRVIGVISKKW